MPPVKKSVTGSTLNTYTGNLSDLLAGLGVPTGELFVSLEIQGTPGKETYVLETAVSS